MMKMMEASDDSSTQQQYRRTTSLENGLPPQQIEGNECHRRSVSFRPDIDAWVVPSLSELKNQLWYDLNEYQRFSQVIKSTIETVSKSNNSLDEDEHCTRGLECMTQEGASRRREKQQTVMDAVLDKQIDIWTEGIPKPEVLAEEYRSHSVPSIQDALARALEDERQAKQYYILEEALAAVCAEGSDAA
jgi:hypothetical protein